MSWLLYGIEPTPSNQLVSPPNQPAFHAALRAICMNPATKPDPADPRYNKRLAIVVPYRNRAEHLARFVPHMVAYFQRDKLDRHISYTINIIEQLGDAPFNRGRLGNFC